MKKVGRVEIPHEAFLAVLNVNESQTMDWSKFEPHDFEYDFDRDELSAHRITFNEAVECFYNDFQVRRNKSFTDRFQLIGQTFGGGNFKIIFQMKPDRIVRIITGWDV